MKVMRITNVLGLLVFLLLVAGPAGADLYNFGADIGGTTIFADGSNYSAAAGMGWTFQLDSSAAAGTQAALHQDKRAAYPALDPALATDGLDIRDAGTAATGKDSSCIIDIILGIEIIFF